MEILQYTAAFLGILGAFLVALRSEYKNVWGFISWVISNSLWVIYGLKTGQYGFTVQFAIFEFFAMLGVWNRRDILKELFVRAAYRVGGGL